MGLALPLTPPRGNIAPYWRRPARGFRLAGSRRRLHSQAEVVAAAVMSAMNFGTKSFKPRPPDRGSFPLDHLGECKEFKEAFMKCLSECNYENVQCRLQAKEYLECRMERQLMSQEPLEKLGFKDLMGEDGKKPEETSSCHPR
uniref:Cytochrome c oxidase assembly protein COX19 n=1 Tax=Petromyzon marinus TaxID=7757 RepID=A0AAJ7TSH1_PETMA|nr:cytochrome c oxidase assembly protein COX19 [Petromyzon marinus]